MTDLHIQSLALVAVLDEQRDLYGRMAILADSQRDALLEGDVDRLTQLVERQEQLIELLNALETPRMTAISAIAAATGRAVDTEMSLREIAAALPAAEAETLIASGAALRAQAERTAALNAENSRLLHSSRELVDRWIGFLRGLLTRQAAYGADGAVHGTADKARILDRSA